MHVIPTTERPICVCVDKGGVLLASPICLSPGVLVTSKSLSCDCTVLMCVVCVFVCVSLTGWADGCQADELLPQGFTNTINTDLLSAWPASGSSSLNITTSLNQTVIEDSEEHTIYNCNLLLTFSGTVHYEDEPAEA